MNRIKLVTIIGLVLLGWYNLNAAEESYSDKLTVAFNDPKSPGFIDLSLVNGGITVVGYAGKEVMIEANVRGKTLKNFDNDKLEKAKAKQYIKAGRDEDQKKNTAGMFKIPILATGLSVEEENNEMKITVESWKHSIDVSVKVPHNTSMNLKCINAGDIVVENVSGELDVNNINGRVTLTNISGTVVAHALNKDLRVTLSKINTEKPMSFSTLNGDIDVTFPGNLKASVQLKSTNGEIYSDFPIELAQKTREVVEQNERKHGGAYRVKIDRTFHGIINGGGVEINFESFNGDIFIRNGK